MSYSVKYPYGHDLLHRIEIEDEVDHLRCTHYNNVFSRNTFITIKVLGSKKKV